MSNNKKNPKRGGSKRSTTKVLLILTGVAAALLVVMLLLCFLIPKREVEAEPSTEPATEAMETTEPAPTETEPPTEATEGPTEPVMLSHMAELYAQNPDIVGWIKIDDTKLDDPVMYTPEDLNKYLRMNFEGKYSSAGLPILDTRCTVDPESPILVIHGHNMINGTKFRSVIAYKDKSFWEAHPVIKFSTLYEEREYEVLAAFEDKIYNKTDEVFKFYQFTDPQTEEEFNEGITYFKEKSEYDTGVTAEFGDRLITLVTCAYHETNGRFVVVAREITNEAETAE